MQHILATCSTYQHVQQKYDPFSDLNEIFQNTPMTPLVTFIKAIDLYRKVEPIQGML